MEKIAYKIRIDADREKVWNILLGQDTYPEWTKAFSENSMAETTWEKGSRARFYDGNSGGMVAIIEDNIPFEYLLLRHMGEIKDGEEDFDSEEVKKWAGAMESYKLESIDGQTVLQIELDISQEFKDYFAETWPKALKKVKEMAETKD